MGRRILLTFLGNFPYQPCAWYKSQDTEKANMTKKDVEFIQEAILRVMFKNPSELSDIFVFTTEAASKENYKVDKEKKEKKEKKNLEEVLGEMKTEFQGNFPNYENVMIEDGRNEDEFWKIFQVVSGKIQDNDEIYLDITNGFRSIPLFCTTLLHYVKVVKKNVTIKGIYYGAFELGTKVEREAPLRPQTVDAPIVDVTSLHALQEWVGAASDFIEFGNSKKIEDLIKNKSIIEEIIQDPNTLSVTQASMANLAKHLKELTSIMAFNRGRDIIKGGVFKNVQDDLDGLKSNVKYVAPLDKILDKISEKITEFNSDNDIENGFKAVDWCIKHQMYQQAITLLQETLLSYILEKLKDNNSLPSNFDIYNYDSRISRKSLMFYNIGNDLEVQPIVQKYKVIFKSLGKPRNSINHAAFTDPEPQPLEFTPGKLEEFITSNYQTIKQMIATD